MIEAQLGISPRNVAQPKRTPGGQTCQHYEYYRLHRQTRLHRRCKEQPLPPQLDVKIS